MPEVKGGNSDMCKTIKLHQAPCSETILFSHFSMKSIEMVAERTTTEIDQEEVRFILVSIPQCHNTPDILFPIEVLRNHPPIISEVSRGGLSFDTSDNPIGLKHNSPTVITE